MPAQEISQPRTEQMALPTNHATAEEPRATETMTAKPMHLRGGGEGADICCGICAGLACFECCEACC